MKFALVFTAALATSATANDIKERLRQLRDPENVDPNVSKFGIALHQVDAELCTAP